MDEQLISRDSRQDILKKMPMLFLTLFTLVSSVQTYMVTVDYGIENECFHERVPKGVKMGFSFEVIEGGFYDIDVAIKDPEGVSIHQESRTSNSRVTIEADREGIYQFCFNNKYASSSPKTIIFNIDRSDQLKSKSNAGEDGTKPDDETTKLMGMVESLLMATISSRHDVRYLAARDRVHRKINDSTNSRIVWWSGIEFILLLSVTLGQVWYLRRFFEIRRKA